MPLILKTRIRDVHVVVIIWLIIMGVGIISAESGLNYKKPLTRYSNRNNQIDLPGTLPFKIPEIINRVNFNRSLSTNAYYNQNNREGEFLLDTSVVYCPPFDNQEFPRIAFNGTYYLIAWRSGRIYWDIWGARVTKSGILLDPAGIAICDAPGDQYYLDVASNGTDFLVVWDYQGGDIYGTRVSSDGIVLDTAYIPICTEGHCQIEPRVASNGNDYFVAWADARIPGNGPYDIYGARVTSTGIILDPDGFPIITWPSNQGCGDIVYGDPHYFIAWDDMAGGPYHIYGLRLNSDGTVIDTNGIVICRQPGSQTMPAIAFDGTNFMVSWFDNRNSEYEVYGSLITSSGTVLDTIGFPINTIGGPFAYYMDMTYDGSNFIVTWPQYVNAEYDIYASRVNSAGVVIDTGGIAVAAEAWYESYCSVASHRDTSFIVYLAIPSSVDIWGKRLASNGHVVDTADILVSSAGNDQSEPAVCFDGTNYLAIWADNKDDRSNIYGLRIDQIGHTLDTIAIPVSREYHLQKSPALAFDGTNFCAVWADFRFGWADIYGCRITTDGVILDPDGFIVSDDAEHQQYPAIVFNGPNYFVFWDSYEIHDIYGTRISPQGVCIDTNAIPVCTASGVQQGLDVAFDNNKNNLVIWVDRRSGADNLYGAIVDTSGTVLTPDGFPISPIVSFESYPSVAFDGTNFLAVWVDLRNGWPDIYGSRITPEGIVLDTLGIPIATAVNDQTDPDVVFNGNEYVVTWTDQRNNEKEIYAARITPSGSVIGEYLVTGLPAAPGMPAMAHGQSDQVLITWQGWTASINGQPVQARRIWGKFYPFDGIEENSVSPLPVNGFDVSVFPNPFQDHCVIRYSYPGISQGRYQPQVSAWIYNANGRLVRDLSIINFPMIGTLIWNGLDDSGRKVASGIYFVLVADSKNSCVRKIIKIGDK